MKKYKIGWENFILEILNKYRGVVTLDELYKEAPYYINKSKAQSFSHNIRGYLTRLKKKNKIKQIGISTYALKELQIKNNFYEDILNKKINSENFLSIPKNEVHGYLEGMLIEIGNMKGFDTYTPDKNIIFNGKRLSEITHYDTIPKFTYLDRLKKILQIDVIWFKDGYPVKTFDVENSTDFTKALLRCYQLKYFKTTYFMVAEKKKENIFKDRITTEPFNEIKESTKLVTDISVYEDYQHILEYTKVKVNSDLL